MTILKSSIARTNPSRRSLRDQVRDDVMGQTGLQRMKDPFCYDPDPAAQASYVHKLNEIVESIHGGELDALQMAMSHFSSTSFGVPIFPTNPLDRPSLQSMSKDGLLESTFGDSWFGRWLG